MRVKLIHLPIILLGYSGYITGGYIVVETIMNPDYMVYFPLIVLPLLYGFGTIHINRHDIGIEESPVRYIADVIFFAKLVLIPFLFYAGGCEMGEYNKELVNFFHPAVLLEISQYLFTIVFLKSAHLKKDRKSMFSFRISRQLTKYLIAFCTALFIGLCLLKREFVTDYFAFFDYQRSEAQMMQMHGALYAIFCFFAQTAYLIVPLFIVAWINKRKRRFGFFLSMPVLILPFIVSTVNHFHSLIIDMTILAYLYVIYPRKRKFIFALAGIGAVVIIPVISFKATSTMLLFVNSYVQGFVNDSAIFMLSASNRLYSLMCTVFKSIPLVAGFFKFLKSDDFFTFALFQQVGRNDQFPSMVGQLWYYFGPLYPFIYFYMIKFLKRLEILIAYKQSDIQKLMGLLLMFNFSYIIFAGNLNSFITMFVVLFIVMLGVNSLTENCDGETEKSWQK